MLFAKHVETAIELRICDLTIDGLSTALRADSISIEQIARPGAARGELCVSTIGEHRTSR